MRTTFRFFYDSFAAVTFSIFFVSFQKLCDVIVTLTLMFCLEAAVTILHFTGNTLKNCSGIFYYKLFKFLSVDFTCAFLVFAESKVRVC
jgi:hypothetical protein